MKKIYAFNFFRQLTRLTVFFLAIAIVLTSCNDSEEIDEIMVAPEPVSPSPKTSTFEANVAVEWNNLLIKLLEENKTIASPLAARAIGYQNLALYESTVNGTTHKSLKNELYRFDGLPVAVDTLEYNWGLAANVAQYTMMQSFFPDADSAQSSQIDALLSKFERTLRGDASQEKIKRSIEYGAAVATAVWQYARQDGLNSSDTILFNNSYVFPDGLGVWKPNPPQIRPLLTQWKLLRPLYFPNKYLSRTPSIPFSYRKESTFFAEALEVYTASKSLTDLQKEKAEYWEGNGLDNNPVRNVFEVLSKAIESKNLTLDQVALLYLKGAIAINDGVIAVWRNKYEVNLVRPDSYLKETLDKNWVAPLGVSYSPSFPSLTATLAGSIGYLISTELGGNVQTPFSTQAITVSDLKSEVIRAAVNGGTNFKYSGEQGYDLGERILKSTNTINF